MSLVALPLFDLCLVLLGALLAGFTTGFAGFGTGLVAAGLWLHVLPPGAAPPLVALCSVFAHLLTLRRLQSSFNWPRAAPYLLGAIVGLPLGVAALTAASPDLLKLGIGALLVLHATQQLFFGARSRVGDWGGRPADAGVGALGGFLGGFAGLSGPALLIWLQWRGEPSAAQRAIYQPFNFLVLIVSAMAMATVGLITRETLTLAMVCLPATVLGAWVGMHAFWGVSEQDFKRVVLALLLLSGVLLLGGGL